MDNKRKNSSDLNRNVMNSRKDSRSRIRKDSAGFELGNDRRIYAASERSYGTRRVDTSRLKSSRERNDDALRRPEQYVRQANEKTKKLTEADRHRRIETEKKRRRLRKQRLQALLIPVLFAICASMLIFMTPLFNIRQITLNGNNVVTKDVIEEKIGDLVGANLFASRKSKIREKMLEIPQISDVIVDKKIFPPTVSLDIRESSPAAYFLSGNTIVVINSELKAIDDSGDFDTSVIPSLSGVSIQGYTLNEKIKTETEEKDDILALLLESFEETGMLGEITYISLDDLTDIKFNYENRIEVRCGSQLEIDRKIRMLREAVKSSEIADDAIGTIDLSVPGMLTYRP